MTDGGPQHDHPRAPTGSQVPWPAPPSGDWGASPHDAPPISPKRGGRVKRGDVVGIAVVLLITGAIVAVAFTVLGGEPRPSAEAKFEKVGQSISAGDPDASSNGFSTIPMEENAGEDVSIADAVPTDEDVVSLLSATGGDVEIQFDGGYDPGLVTVVCADRELAIIDGYARVWINGRRDVEVDIRIHEAASAGEVTEAMEARSGRTAIDCLPGKTGPIYADGDVVDGRVVDSSDVGGDDDERQISVLVEDANGAQALWVWRQVGAYQVYARITDLDPTGGARLDLTSADAFLDHASDVLGG